MLQYQAVQHKIEYWICYKIKSVTQIVEVIYALTNEGKKVFQYCYQELVRLFRFILLEHVQVQSRFQQMSV